ncbi:hypothetical protein Sjap_010670 [Stephania japonica]|uniref:Uncharacterized protein n=1 Tax=Stephania japonica TaxID=461633 RepID=A0AAP0JA16_9MAGN
MGRAPCCDKANVKRGPWSPEEDAKLKAYIEQYGTGGNWIALPQKIGLKRCGKSCRLRWLNYLRPNIKHGGFSEEEDNIICSLYISIGSRWSIIAAQLPGRTDNDIKNYWNTRLKKKLLGRRKDSHQARRQSPENEDVPNRIEDTQTLSNSALERLQLHMQLQSIQHPFSFYNNPALWPKLHPLVLEKTIQDHLGLMSENSLASMNRIPQSQPYLDQRGRRTDSNQFDHKVVDDHSSIGGGFSSSETNSVAFNNIDLISSDDANLALDATRKSNEKLKENIESVSSLQAELKELLYTKTNGFEAEKVHGDQTSTDHDQFDCFKESLMWWNNEFDTKSSSSNSWDSSTSLVQSEGLFDPDYVLGYDHDM